MFTKLLKHEFKTASRIMLPLSIAMIVTGVLSSGVLAAIIHLQNIDNGSYSTTLLVIPLFFLIGLCFFALIAYLTACPILMYVQFYRTRFTDQGYLTFTLPANPSQILLSSYLNTICWICISFLVAIIAAVFPGIVLGVTENIYIEDIKNILSGFLWLLSTTFLPLIAMDDMNIVIILLSWLVSSLASLMLYHAVITLGCVLAKNHKVLVCFILLYVINGAVQMINQMIQFFCAILFGGAEEMGLGALFIPQTVVMLTVLIGSYFLSTYLMKNKLNL